MPGCPEARNSSTIFWIWIGDHTKTAFEIRLRQLALFMICSQSPSPELALVGEEQPARQTLLGSPQLSCLPVSERSPGSCSQRNRKIVFSTLPTQLNAFAKRIGSTSIGQHLDHGVRRREAGTAQATGRG